MAGDFNWVKTREVNKQLREKQLEIIKHLLQICVCVCING